MIWSNKVYPGKLIAFCGLDGSGKTTQLTMLSDYLKSCGHDTYTTRQPTDWYRNLPIVKSFLQDGGNLSYGKVLALLSAADRIKHIDEDIEPKLQIGSFVLTDRYVFSALAYFSIRGVDSDFVEYINHGIPKPDLTFFIDVPVEEIVGRLRNRDNNNLKYEERDISKLHRIRESYLLNHEDLEIVDGLKSREEISNSVILNLNSRGII